MDIVIGCCCGVVLLGITAALFGQALHALKLLPRELSREWRTRFNGLGLVSGGLVVAFTTEQAAREVLRWSLIVCGVVAFLSFLVSPVVKKGCSEKT